MDEERVRAIFDSNGFYPVITASGHPVIVKDENAEGIITVDEFIELMNQFGWIIDEQGTIQYRRPLQPEEVPQ